MGPTGSSQSPESHGKKVSADGAASGVRRRPVDQADIAQIAERGLLVLLLAGQRRSNRRLAVSTLICKSPLLRRCTRHPRFNGALLMCGVRGGEEVELAKVGEAY